MYLESNRGPIAVVEEEEGRATGQFEMGKLFDLKVKAGKWRRWAEGVGSESPTTLCIYYLSNCRETRRGIFYNCHTREQQPTGRLYQHNFIMHHTSLQHVRPPGLSQETK